MTGPKFNFKDPAVIFVLVACVLLAGAGGYLLRPVVDGWFQSGHSAIDKPEQTAIDWDNRELLEGNPCYAAGLMLEFAKKPVDGPETNVRGVVLIKKPPTNACWRYFYPFFDTQDVNKVGWKVWMEAEDEGIVSFENSDGGAPQNNGYGPGRHVEKSTKIRACVQERDPRAQTETLIGQPTCTEYELVG